MAVLGSAIIQITADTAKIRRDLSKVRGMFGKLQKNVVSVANKIKAAFATMLIGIGVTRGFKKIIKSASDFESALTDMARVTKRSFMLLRADIASIGPELGSATELMKGYYQVISAGVTKPRKALRLLVVASKAAKAAHIDQAAVIKGLTALMAGFAGKIKDATVASDLLFATEEKGKTTFAELIPVIGGLGKLADDLNITFDEMAGSLAQVTLTAGSTEEATTRLEGLFIALMKPSIQLTSALGELKKVHTGMAEASAAALIKEVGFVQAIREIAEQSHGSELALKKLVVRKQGMIALSALLSENMKGVAMRIEAMGNKAGRTEDAFRKFEHTFKGAMEKFMNTMDNVAKRFGTLFLPTLTKGFNKLSTAIGFLQEQADNLNLNSMGAEIIRLQSLIDVNEEKKGRSGLLLKWISPVLSDKAIQEAKNRIISIRKEMAALLSARFSHPGFDEAAPPIPPKAVLSALSQAIATKKEELTTERSILTVRRAAHEILINRAATLEAEGLLINERLKDEETFLESLKEQGRLLASNGAISESAMRKVQIQTIKQMELIHELKEKQKELTGSFSEGWEIATEKMVKDLGGAFKRGEQMAKDVAGAMTDSFEIFFFDAMRGEFNSFREYFQGFLQSIQQALARMLAEMVAIKLIAGVTSLATAGAGVGGGGNSFASGATSSSSQGLSTFKNPFHDGGFVKKLHRGGLASDEVPAILQTGEGVLSRKGMGNLNALNSGSDKGGGGNTFILIQANDTQSFLDALNRNSGGVVKILSDDLRRDGPSRRAIQRAR